ncbi:unnamed protein product [Pseudo-nitzschia multistriata]|uniref:Uncharacterized protein n=1 Tax=Pseudo-nitzschia multistriata TaxID=183589 RepID=A0A448ZSJ6_9STRA|nr:unnamed protein product [Pseudo-nitzschia multistriata]
MPPQQQNTGICTGRECKNITRGANDEEECDDDEDHFEDSYSVPLEEMIGEEATRGIGVSRQHTNSLYEAPPAWSLAPSIFPSFVQSGLEGKASFTELKYWIALSLTLDGRDKITKVLQYASRLMAWWLVSSVHSSRISRAHARRFTSLYKSLGSSRKAFRLGRSINEIHKISSMGLFGLFYWHLKQQYLEDNRKSIVGHDKGGLREENAKENDSSPGKPPCVNSFLEPSRSLRAKFDANLVGFTRRIQSLLLSSFVAVFPSNEDTSVVWWKLIGSLLKTLGMLGYWLGDNANFLTSSGALDDYSLSDKSRLERRKNWLETTAKKANQFYFFATIVGLATNHYSYYRFGLKSAMLGRRGGQSEEGCSGKLEPGEDNDRVKHSEWTKQKEEEKQFSLFLAVLKSWMDVIVFSNNPGIDLHKKLRGRKNHEVIHCLCGLISAGTSLLSNFPDANK